MDTNINKIKVFLAQHAKQQLYTNGFGTPVNTSQECKKELHSKPQMFYGIVYTRSDNEFSYIQNFQGFQ